MTVATNNERETDLEASYDSIGSIETNVLDGFTLTSVGDVILSRPISQYTHPGFHELVALLQGSDATFGNMETLIFDIRTFSGSPAAEHGGAYHVSLPAVAPDLRAMGFNIVGCANNHTLDWGLEGMRATCQALDESGIVHAGTGENHAQAGAARFLETAKGRVALVSFATSFTPMSRACDPAGEAPGRAGVNALRLTRSITVTAEMLQNLRDIRDQLPYYNAQGSDECAVNLAGTEYKLGSSVGYSYNANGSDVAEIARNVRRGKQFSDFCIAASHGHHPGNWSDEPADYEQAFARGLIDSGADVYVAQGPHRLRGIELYKSRPIFYGLGNFIMDDLRTPVGADMFDSYDKDPQTDTDADVTVAEMTRGYETAPGLNSPVFYESVVAVSRFERNELAELRLYPIELGYSKRFANRGIPRLASPEQAREILVRLQNLSKPYGTHISVYENVGVIKLK